ncbi:MAG: flippase [Candidatus Dormibacteraeota bacterium]|nr:flippase [Candidatus Dormibacteraeota bacterium]
MSVTADALGARTPRNAVLILAARTVSRVIALVMVLVMANHLGATGYGRFGTLVAYSALIGVVADLGLSTLFTREAARRPDQLGDYLSTLIVGRIPLVLAAIGLLSIALWQAGLSSLILPGALLLALSGYSTMVRNSFYATGRLGLEVVAILVEIGVLSTLIFAGARIGAGVSWFVWSYVASYVASISYTVVILQGFGIGRLRLRFDRALFKDWLFAALPLAAGFLLTNLYFRADIPILQHFRPFAEVGWYQLAYKPFEATQFVPLAVQAVVYPLLSVYFASAPDRLDQAYQKFFKVLLLAGWPLTVTVFTLVHPLGRVLHLYPQSEPALRILAFGIVFLFINSAFTAMLFSTNRQGRYAWATATAAAVNIALNLALIPLFGYLAASTTTVVTEAVLSIAGWWLVGRTRLPWLRIGWRVVAAGAILGLVLLPLARFPVYVGLAVAPFVYLGALLLLRAFDDDEKAVFRLGMRRLGLIKVAPPEAA